MKKLIIGTVLLTLSAGPALAERAGLPGLMGDSNAGHFSSASATNTSKVTIGNTSGTIRNGGTYSVNATVSNIGASVVQQSFANVELHAPTFGIPGAAADGTVSEQVHNGPSNASVVSQTLENGAISFETLRSEDGLTDIVEAVIGSMDAANDPNEDVTRGVPASIFGIVTTATLIPSRDKD